MIDHTKIELPVEVGLRLLDHKELSFRRPVDEQTGELSDTEKRCAVYRGLTFTHYVSGRTTMHGSFHKYAQDGENWGEYKYTQFLVGVAEVCKTFDLDPNTLRLLQLEVGANVTPPIRTKDALKAIVCHREGKAFSPMRSWNGQSLGLELYREHYAIKCYDKGYQFGLPFDVLRFEVKFRKALPLNSLGIYTLNDLLNVNAWQKLQDRVMVIYDELAIADPFIDLTKLTISQRTFVTIATAPRFWSDRKRNQRLKDRGRYADIVENFASRNLKDELRTALFGQLNDLLNVPSLAIEIGDNFTNIPRPAIQGQKGRIHSSVNVGTGHPMDTGNDGSVNPTDLVKQTRNNGGNTVEGAEVTTSRVQPITVNNNGITKVIGAICDPSTRSTDQPGKVPGPPCTTCGRPTGSTRKGSRFCSAKVYGEQSAKQCRNANSNPRNNRLRTLERIEKDPLLFDHSRYIRPLGTYHANR